MYKYIYHVTNMYIYILRYTEWIVNNETYHVNIYIYICICMVNKKNKTLCDCAPQGINTGL